MPVAKRSNRVAPMDDGGKSNKNQDSEYDEEDPEEDEDEDSEGSGDEDAPQDDAVIFIDDPMSTEATESQSWRSYLTYGRNPRCPEDFLYNPFSGMMPYTDAWCRKSFAIEFVDAVLRGLGQVIFLNNPVTGIFMLIAAILNDHYLTILGMLGIFASTATAYAFRFPRDAIKGGIFGYNGYLVGTAMGVFLADYGGDWNPILIIPAIMGGALSSFLSLAMQNIMNNIAGKPSAVFTFPFHIITWIWILGSQRWAYFPSGITPEINNITTPMNRHEVYYNSVKLGQTIFVSIGQVYFFGTVASGVLCFIGVFIASRIAAIAAFTGACIGVFGAVGLGAVDTEIYSGLWGYDATLAAVCVGGLFFRLSPRVILLAVIASVFSVLLHGAMRSFFFPVGLPPLTFAAACTCFMFTSMGKIFPKVYVLPLSDVRVPEENFDV